MKSFKNDLKSKYIKFNSLTGSKMNMLQINKKGTYSHELMKFKLLWLYLLEGYDCYTEVELKKGGRPDLIVFKGNDAKIIEVVNSEKQESIESKKSKYPKEFQLIFINSKTGNEILC